MTDEEYNNQRDEDAHGQYLAVVQALSACRGEPGVPLDAIAMAIEVVFKPEEIETIIKHLESIND